MVSWDSQVRDSWSRKGLSFGMVSGYKPADTYMRHLGVNVLSPLHNFKSAEFLEMFKIV